MAGWSTRYIDEFQTELKLHLKETGTLWSTTELTRAITHALADFSRFYPRERFYEVRLDFDAISDESVTLVGGTKALTYKPVKWESETVVDTDDNACVRGTDYEMDYIAGTITRIAGGEIASATETITVSYTRDKTAVDISSLSTQTGGYMRIHKVEYPVGDIPQDYVTFKTFGDILFITSKKGGTTQSQGNLQNDRHARILYYAPHTVAGVSTAPTSPVWSDEIIIKGAEAYCWLIEAAQQEHTAIDYLVTAATTLENCWKSTDSGALKDAETALAAASAALVKITGGAYQGAATTALAAAAVELGLMPVSQTTGSELYNASQVEDCDAGNEGATFLSTATANAISAEAYLTAGDAFVESVNQGVDIAPIYLTYANGAGLIGDRLRDHARLHIEQGTLHIQVIMGYVQEAQGRLRQIENLNAEAQSEIGVGNGYARVGETLVAQAQAELGIVLQRLEVAEKYREMGILRRNEFWAILGDRSQGGGDKVATGGSHSASGTPRSDGTIG